MAIAGVAAVVFLVVLFSIFASGLVHLSSSNGSSSGGGVTFEGALHSAAPLLAKYPGTWSLIGAVGISGVNPFAINNSNLNHDCPYEGPPLGVTHYPAGPSDYSTGEAGLWQLSYIGTGAANATMFVQVVDGVASLQALINTTATCPAEYSTANVVPNVIDSSDAMSIALSTPGGGSFTKMFPAANVTYLLLGPPGQYTPAWVIALNHCARSPNPPGVWLISMYATNGTLMEQPPAIGASC